MPYLEIKSCTDCPFAVYPYHIGEETYAINCGHEESTSKEQVKKISNTYGIFFTCPLPMEIVSPEE